MGTERDRGRNRGFFGFVRNNFLSALVSAFTMTVFYEDIQRIQSNGLRVIALFFIFIFVTSVVEWVAYTNNR